MKNRMTTLDQVMEKLSELNKTELKSQKIELTLVSDIENRMSKASGLTADIDENSEIISEMNYEVEMARNKRNEMQEQLDRAEKELAESEDSEGLARAILVDSISDGKIAFKELGKLREKIKKQSEDLGISLPVLGTSMNLMVSIETSINSAQSNLRG